MDVPKITELNFLKLIKELNINSKVMFIGSLVSIKEAYKYDCYDFIKKPVSIYQLLLKIKRIKDSTNSIVVGEMFIYYKDLGRLCVEETNYIQLSKKEDILFNLLLSNRGRIMYRDYIIDFIYGSSEVSAFSSLINRLRKKIPNGIIKTFINGAGYYIE